MKVIYFYAFFTSSLTALLYHFVLKIKKKKKFSGAGKMSNSRENLTL